MNSMWQPRKPLAIAAGGRCVNLKFLRPSFTCLRWCSRKKVLSLSCISTLWLKCSPSLIWESGVSSLVPANQEAFQSFLSLDNPHYWGGCQSHSILVLKPVWSVCVLQSCLCLGSFRKDVVRAGKHWVLTFFLAWQEMEDCWATGRAAGKCMRGPNSHAYTHLLEYKRL